MHDGAFDLQGRRQLAGVGAEALFEDTEVAHGFDSGQQLVGLADAVGDGGLDLGGGVEGAVEATLGGEGGGGFFFEGDDGGDEALPIADGDDVAE